MGRKAALLPSCSVVSLTAQPAVFLPLLGPGVVAAAWGQSEYWADEGTANGDQRAGCGQTLCDLRLLGPEKSKHESVLNLSLRHPMALGWSQSCWICQNKKERWQHSACSQEDEEGERSEDQRGMLRPRPSLSRPAQHSEPCRLCVALQP